MHTTIVFTQIQTEEQVDLLLEKSPSFTIMLYNDDVNTFDFVIETLIEVCGHQVEQAEQVAYIVHYKGKCDVKRGEFDELEPICNELLRRGLSASIEKLEN